MKKLDRQTTTAMAASFIRTRPHLQPFTPNGHLSKWAQTVDRLNLPEETDIIENTTLNRPYKVNITILTNDTKKYIRHSEYTAYTDGSKIDDKTGVGLIIYKHKEIVYR